MELGHERVHPAYPGRVISHFGFYLLAVLSSCRLNRLVVTDVITHPLRAWLAKRSGLLGRFLSMLVSCTWCVGMYTAAACASYVHWAVGWDWSLLPLTTMSIGWAAPVLAGWIED